VLCAAWVTSGGMVQTSTPDALPAEAPPTISNEASKTLILMVYYLSNDGHSTVPWNSGQVTQTTSELPDIAEPEACSQNAATTKLPVGWSGLTHHEMEVCETEERHPSPDGHNQLVERLEDEA